MWMPPMTDGKTLIRVLAALKICKAQEYSSVKKCTRILLFLVYHDLVTRKEFKFSMLRINNTVINIDKNLELILKIGDFCSIQYLFMLAV